MGHLNIEIKARCRDTKRLDQILREKGADFKGLDHQIDTYFEVPKGRLKLREGSIEKTLIQYRRPDQDGPKASQVNLLRLNETAELKAALMGALETKVIVDKRRAIYFIDNVKFHLDEVAELGTFVEIEAIDFEGKLGDKFLHAQCEEYIELLGIRQADLLSMSYSDMLLESA